MPDIKQQVQDLVPTEDIPAPPLEQIRRRGRSLLRRRRWIEGTSVALFALVVAAGVVLALNRSSGRVERTSEPEPGSGAATQPSPTETAEPELELIDDGVISIRPKQVRPGATMTIVIRNPPGSWGLGWYLARKDGSEWVYIGGFRAGPPGQWAQHRQNRFYFLPRWRNVGLEDVPFDGNDSIDLKVPKLEPGTYRIVASFIVAREDEWHVDVFEVIGP